MLILELQRALNSVVLLQTTGHFGGGSLFSGAVSENRCERNEQLRHSRQEHLFMDMREKRKRNECPAHAKDGTKDASALHMQERGGARP